MIDKDDCSLDDIVTWAINEMSVSDEVCGNDYRGHALPDFIGDVVYDQVFKDAIDTMGIDFSIDFLTNGNGRHYVDSIVRLYCLDRMYCDIFDYIYDNFDVEEQDV